MPTASPSIRARIGAVLVSPTTPLSANSPAMPAPTPISAVSMVMPAATSEPRVTTRTASATRTPMPSVPPISGSLCMTSPPCSTRRPACSAAAPEWAYASRCASVIASSWAANCTWTSACRPSGEIAPAANGSTAATAPGRDPASRTTAATAARASGSCRLRLAGAAITIVPVVPLACGNSRLRESMARCDSVPGIVKSLVVGFMNAAAAPPSATSRTSQRATTSRRRWKDARPRR